MYILVESVTDSHEVSRTANALYQKYETNIPRKEINTVYRRKIRLAADIAKCRHLKKLTCKGTLRSNK
jgi:hypothetical protein